MSEPVTLGHISTDQIWYLRKEDGTTCGELKYHTHKWETMLEIKMDDGTIYNTDVGKSWLIALRSLLQLVGLELDEQRQLELAEEEMCERRNDD